MKQQKIIASIILILLVAVVLVSLTSSKKMNFSFETETQAASTIPTHILYDHLFRLVISFQKKAIEQRIRGEQITTLTDYFQTEAGLTEEQNQSLSEVANLFIEEVEPIDNQALALISAARENYPDGQISPDQQIPQPPSELLDLQNQRNALALNFREKLNNRWGKKAFESFDSYIHKKFAQNFQAIGTQPNN
jgi:hypothetical protein